MPIPKVIIDQIKQIIPPLNGTLHKGQSGASSSTLVSLRDPRLRRQGGRPGRGSRVRRPHSHDPSFTHDIVTLAHPFLQPCPRFAWYDRLY